MRTGTATLEVNGDTVVAEPDEDGLTFTADVPSRAVTVNEVDDGCGNTGG